MSMARDLDDRDDSDQPPSDDLKPPPEDEDLPSSSHPSAFRHFQVLRYDTKADRRPERKRPNKKKHLNIEVCGRPVWCSSISLSASFRRKYKAAAKKRRNEEKESVKRCTSEYDLEPKPIVLDWPPANMVSIDNNKKRDSPLFSECESMSVEDEAPPRVRHEHISFCRAFLAEPEKKPKRRRLRGVLKISLYARRRHRRRSSDDKCVCSGRHPNRSKIYEKNDWRANSLAWVWGDVGPGIPAKAKTIHNEGNFYKDGFAKAQRFYKHLEESCRRLAGKLENADFDQSTSGDSAVLDTELEGTTISVGTEGVEDAEDNSSLAEISHSEEAGGKLSAAEIGSSEAAGCKLSAVEIGSSADAGGKLSTAEIGSSEDAGGKLSNGGCK